MGKSILMYGSLSIWWKLESVVLHFELFRKIPFLTWEELRDLAGWSPSLLYECSKVIFCSIAKFWDKQLQQILQSKCLGTASCKGFETPFLEWEKNSYFSSFDNVIDIEMPTTDRRANLQSRFGNQFFPLRKPLFVNCKKPKSITVNKSTNETVWTTSLLIFFRRWHFKLQDALVNPANSTN